MRTPAEPAGGRPPTGGQHPEPRHGGAPGDSLSGVLLEGRYRIGARIARGGMSTVYRGVDLRLDRPVAIKVMTPQYAADPTFLVRFEREARAAAGLDNPAVVGVYDQGRDGEHVFLVMELVDGGTLRDLLHRSGELSVPVALSVLEPLLSALAAAHAAGLVHRDVKPENVLISGRGEVKVADFGLVRAVTSTTMATGNVILGTVAYLSPEQVATGAADERSDVYSAGIVAYEMLTGHPPFGGDNALSVAYQHVHSDVPPVADEAPGVPVGIAAAVDAATSRDPLGRPVNAADFLDRLRGARQQVGLALAPVPVPRPPRRRDRQSGSAGHAALAAAGPDGADRADGAAGADGADGAAGGTGGGRATSGDGTSGSSGPTGDAHSGYPGTASTGRTDPGAQHTRVAGHGTSPAGRPDRLTTAEAAGGRSRSGRRARQRPDRGDRAGRVHRTSRLRRRHRWRRTLIVLLIVLLIGAAAAFGGWWLGGRWTSTPRVVGTSQQDAVDAVRNAGLVPALSTAHSNATPSGQVASVDPPGGTRQLHGATVSLVVSSGRPVVPTITPGTSVAAARALLRAADLTPVTDAKRDVYSNSVAAGAVVRTEPKAGSDAKIAAHVLLIRSRGPVPEQVPIVAGKEPEDARNKLLVAGFTIGPATTTFDPHEPPGSVVGTDPPAGSTVPHGSAISLVLAVSKTVPNLAGSTLTEARTELEGDGFDVTVGDPVFDPSKQAGVVVRTDPPSGTRIDPADPQVTLIPSNAVTVPALVGSTVQQAEDDLADAGLTDELTSLFGLGDSVVIAQYPPRGTLVEPGSAVQLNAMP